jgi:hypothetical protein
MLEFLTLFVFIPLLLGVIARFIIWPFIYLFLYVFTFIKYVFTPTPKIPLPTMHYLKSNITTYSLSLNRSYPIYDVISKPTPEGNINYIRTQDDNGAIVDIPEEFFTLTD